MSLSEVPNADVYLNPIWELSYFESVLLQTTPLGQVKALSSLQREVHRQRILYSFDRLADFSVEGGPVFVFAHILAPHSPFVFEVDRRLAPDDDKWTLRNPASGEEARWRHRVSYSNQVKYVSLKIQQVLERMFSKPHRPAVIILQSDHGSRINSLNETLKGTDLRERLSILNAIYLPETDYSGLYPDITPVNTFRFILNRYFGAKLELLKDESYFSPWSRPYDFLNVTAWLQ
jgi:membrane-anchored protein YejM (alkaline phosphatase superfamily)